jgi:hypothetical protein
VYSWQVVGCWTKVLSVCNHRKEQGHSVLRDLAVAWDVQVGMKQRQMVGPNAKGVLRPLRAPDVASKKRKTTKDSLQLQSQLPPLNPGHIIPVQRLQMPK